MGVILTQIKFELDPIKFYLDFPEDQNEAKKLWDLWKNHKQDIKADGFNVRLKKNKWIIRYRTVNDKEANEIIKLENGKSVRYSKIHFIIKCGKWQSVIS